MKRDVIVILLCFLGGLAGANVTPILSGSGKILFPENATAANISASAGALNLNAGGTNQNVNATPTGSGVLNASTSMLIANNSNYRQYDSAGTPRSVLWLDNSNPDVLTLQNNQRGNGGPLKINTGAGGTQSAYIDASGKVRIGSGTPSYVLDVNGDVNTSTLYRASGNAGFGSGLSVTVCTSGACITSCTLIFNGGIRTGGTCP
jgi:hypothetical protein